MSNEKTKHHPVRDDTTPLFPGTVSGVEPEPSGEQRIMHPSETNVPERHTSPSENMYRTIFETTGTAIIVIEGDKTISMANNELEKITGFKKEEVEGKKKWTEFIAARDLQRLIGYHELRRKDPSRAPRNYEFLLKHAGGGYRNIYMTIGIVPGTDISVGSLIDLTDKKEKEMALAASEERYRLLAENAREVIIVYDMDGRITYINRAGSGMTGMSGEELQGMKITDLIPFSRNINLYKALRDNTVGDDEVFINKTGFVNRSGEYLELETSSTVIRIDGRMEGILVIARDITERKRLEREILQISEGIRQQVGRDLHDDLSPHLIGIEALTEVLKLRLGKRKSKTAGEVEKIQLLINEAITKTHRLVKGLCPVDVGAEGLAAALGNLAERICSIYGTDCSFVSEPGIVPGNDITAINLYYVAQEAAYNAVKHSGAKSITIRLSREKGSITLSVVDDGAGIPLPLPRSRGNGLRIMKYRAEIMNGSLRIRRNTPCGTAVICFLPEMNAADEGVK